MPAPVFVYVAYCSSDEEDLALWAELAEHLSPLRRRGLLNDWHVGQMLAGEVHAEIHREKLENAHVVLLLVSASFLASDECVEQQMKPALLRALKGAARIVPILLRACDWKGEDFGEFSVLPRNQEPVTSWENRDEAWAEIVKAIRDILDDCIAAQSKPDKTNKIELEKPSRPEPHYPDLATQKLSETFREANDRRKKLQSAGADTKIVDDEIRTLKRALREGGQLRAGDSLGDGRYLLIEPIGKGGFSIVWRAYDEELKRDVAIKVLHTELAGDSLRRDRFFRGARRMVELAGEGVVPILEPAGEDGGYRYFVMELIEGGDLRRAVLGKRVQSDRVIPLILKVGRALSRAHAKSLIHRDIKPANILLDKDGNPWLSDFDLVAGGADSTGGTRTDAALGTVGYAAPELLLDAQKAGPRADVYGLGMTALFALHGSELRQLVVYGVAEGVRRIIEGLECHSKIKEVLAKAVSVEPEHRQGDAAEFCDALQKAWEESQKDESTEPIQQVVKAEAEEIPNSVELRAAKDILDPGEPTMPGFRKTVEQQRAQEKEKDNTGKKIPPNGRQLFAITGAMAVGLGLVSLGAYALGFRQSSKANHPIELNSAQIGTTVKNLKAIIEEIQNAQKPPPPPPPCLEGMVFISGGEFNSGALKGESVNQKALPPKTVQMQSFCIDLFEISVASYHGCVGAGVCSSPGNRQVSKACNELSAEDRFHPVNCVDWKQAQTYCEWAGKRLPTELEWEFAARGTEARKYPWGNEEPRDQPCWNGIGNSAAVLHRESTCNFFSNDEDLSAFGVRDMGGNVTEWVQDEVKAPGVVDGHIIRGGSWASTKLPQSNERMAWSGSKKDPSVGFRCAKDTRK